MSDWIERGNTAVLDGGSYRCEVRESSPSNFHWESKVGEVTKFGESGTSAKAREAAINSTVSGEVESVRETDILLRADEITRVRGASYGHPIDNFRRIAAYWNVWLENKLAAPITEEDVPMMMVQVKMSREQNNVDPDNPLDIAGYTKNYVMVKDAKAAAAKRD